MAEKIEETSVEPETPPSKSKKKLQTETLPESGSDLRTLLLILALAVIVFFMLLYKRSYPEEYSQSLAQVKESADATYSKAEEVLPVAYRGVGGFFEYVFDYGKAVDLPPELPKVRIPQDPTVAEFVSDALSGSLSSTGSLSSSGSVSATGADIQFDASTGAVEDSVPMSVELSGYRIEFDRPPAENVTVSIGGAKMTVGPAVPTVEKDNVPK